LITALLPVSFITKAAAGGPFDIFVGEPGGSTATWTGGAIVGNPDPVAPGGPTCVPGCDRTPFTLHLPTGYTTNHVVSITATATFDTGSSNPLDSGATADIAILDSSDHVIASTIASGSPASVTANDLPAGNYIVEVDGDIGGPGDSSYAGSLSGASTTRPAVPPPQLSTQITFSTPTVVDPIHTYGEPDVRVDHHGRVFVSGPTGTGTQRSVWSASVDSGATWREIAQGPPPTSISPNPLTQPGGGDTDIAFDQSDKQYFADLYALACQRTMTTTNAGASVMENPAGCAVPGSDRQWLLVYDPPRGTVPTSKYAGSLPLVYLEYNDVVTIPANGSTGPSYWTKSVPDAVPGDPGLFYTPAHCAGVVGCPPAPERAVFGADGYPSIDQVTGKVFQATYSGSTIKLNIGTPDASGNLTFLDDAAGGTANLITVATGVVNNGDVANFVVSSMDDARNLWVTWVGRDNSNPANRQVWAAVSSAASGWTVWSKPVQLSQPPSLVNIFPWIKAAGKNGVADVVWYGSNVPGRPGFYPDPSTDLNQVWDVYMGQVTFPTDANGGVQVLNGPAFTPTQTLVTPHHMDYNSACLQGTGCILSQGNRNLADFFEVNADANGAAVIVYDDMSNGLCQTAPGFTPAGDQTADHCGAALVTVARQATGPGLLGSDVPATKYPSPAPLGNGVQFGDGSGDALFPVIAGGPVPSSNVPGMDLLGTSLSLSAGTLTVTNKVLDLSNPAATAATLGATSLQYVTRWQMGNTIYYAMAEYGSVNPLDANQPANPACPLSLACFYAGAAQTTDLCSVSACDPHYMVYPESGAGPALTGHSEGSGSSVSCPTSPSVSNPCTITIKVNAADVGNPANTSLLEEVGTYALSSSHNQAPLTNAQAQLDNAPLEIDGLCCFNFQETPPTVFPEAPWTPAVVAVGSALIIGGFVFRRRRANAKWSPTGA
jgi:hypothetical protein